MKFDKKAIAIIMPAWLATLALGVWIGRGADSPSPGDQAEDTPQDRLALASTSSRSVAPDTALLSLAKYGGDRDGLRSPRELARALNLEEVKAAAATLEELDASPSQVVALKAVLERWAQLDPFEAMSYASGVEAPKRRHDAKLSVLRGWGGTDPAAALDYIQANPHETEMGEAKEAIFDGLETGDMGVAFDFLDSVNTPGTSFGNEAYFAVQELFLRNDRAVIDWVGTLAPGEVRDRAIYSLMDEWARYDPESARTWLEGQDGDKHKHEARVELGESWARVDPQAALDWASGIEADPRSISSVRERIFTRWLQYDLESAAEYLVSQEPAPELDHAFELYVGKAQHFDPGATMAWAESITDPSRRVRAMRQVASVWRNRDREAFDAYLQGSGLSEGDVNSLQ
jgi:hypothetical protein